MGSDDDKEELGGVPVLIWRGAATRTPRRALPSAHVAEAAQFRAAARGPDRSTLARPESKSRVVPAETVEAWEVALDMKAPRSGHVE